jgi:hypothetical protein
MENLIGHETGNGGYCQGDTYGNSPSLDPTSFCSRLGFHLEVEVIVIIVAVWKLPPSYSNAYFEIVSFHVICNL